MGDKLSQDETAAFLKGVKEPTIPQDKLDETLGSLEKSNLSQDEFGAVLKGYNAIIPLPEDEWVGFIECPIDPST